MAAADPSSAQSVPASVRTRIDIPLDVFVPVAPRAVRAGGQEVLGYELHVTNFHDRGLTLSRLDVMGDHGVLAAYDQTRLVGMVARPGQPASGGTDSLYIGPGLRTVVFLWLAPKERPTFLEHRVTVQLEGTGAAAALMCAKTPVKTGVPVLGPPLLGTWQACNGPADTSDHRRTMLAVGGRAHIAQRFAIDWQKLGADGRPFSGDEAVNKNHRGYGAQALAVADGVVTAVRDGIPENKPGEDTRAVPVTIETIAGNHVILKLADGTYALYAHLQPGSLGVKTGDSVKRGQVLGLVGNSGNSTAPHLHFHLSDENSPLGSEGIPYVFDSFEASGTLHRSQLPTRDQIVTFK